jgi:inner membrane protein
MAYLTCSRLPLSAFSNLGHGSRYGPISARFGGPAADFAVHKVPYIKSMQGKTHFAAGMAIALAIMPPASIPMLVIGTASAGVGGVLPDIDVGSSHAAKGVARAVVLTAAAGGVILLADLLGGMNIISRIRESNTLVRMIAGYICLLTLCGIGGATDHRTATHSFLYAAMTTATVCIIYPPAAPYFLIGYLSHLALDFINKMGEELFWPSKHTYNISLCRSDGAINALLLFVCTLATIWLIISNPALLAVVRSSDAYAAALPVASRIVRMAKWLTDWMRNNVHRKMCCHIRIFLL